MMMIIIMIVVYMIPTAMINQGGEGRRRRHRGAADDGGEAGFHEVQVGSQEVHQGTVAPQLDGLPAAAREEREGSTELS